VLTKRALVACVQHAHLHRLFFAQIACLWRMIVDIEGDAMDPNSESWIQGEAAAKQCPGGCNLP